jgi:outer membrane protein OmpA-like peptidoglycan-associated protein
MRKSIYYFVVLTLISTSLFSQKIINRNPEKSADKFGIFGGVSFNSYKTDFVRLPDLPCCGKTFNDGSGIGFYAGLLYDHPFTELIWLNLKLGYISNEGLLKKNETALANLNGNSVNAVFEQSIETGFSYIFLEPNLSFNVWKNLFLEIGVDLKLNVGKTYTQKETILEPSGGFFENNSRERLVSSGDIKDVTSLNYALNAGLYYDIPLDKKNQWYLSPEIQYHYGLNTAIENLNFKINYLTLGLGIKYSPAYEPQKDDNIEKREETTKNQNISLETAAYGVGKDSTARPVLQFHVEEFLSTQLKPLVTYIFFDENSSEIPKRYNLIDEKETQEFDENKIKNKDILYVYYDILNIIGKRLKNNPNANITLEGCNSNLGDEKGNTGLSNDRAVAVKRYLMNTWGISEDRIILKKRNLPLEPSNSNEAEGVVENRRVEITSNTFETIAPLIANDTLRIVDPPSVRFFNNVKSENGVKSWNLTASQDGKILKNFSDVDSVPNSIDWTFSHDQKSAPKSGSPVEYQLTVNDKNNESAVTPLKSLPVDYLSIQKKKRNRVKDKYIDRYDLILFKFGDSKLSDINSKIIENIKKDLKPSSVITVIGHTDITGTNEINKKLSLERAKIVSEAFAPYKTQFQGVGMEDPMTLNSLPEGRFYNRYVEIVVETEVDN